MFDPWCDVFVHTLISESLPAVRPRNGLSVSVSSFLKLHRVRSVYVLKTSLSASLLQFGSPLFVCLGGKSESRRVVT